MKNTTNKLTQWVIDKIEREYPDDIALLVAKKDSAVNGDGHGEAFDYFVPATERGEALAQTFIIGGVGKDLYPRSWERIERTANLEDLATTTLDEVEIVYARSEADEARFWALRQKLFENLANPAFTYKKALENLEVAMDLYRTMLFEERLWKVRCLAGYIHKYLKISVACLNGTYWKAWHNGVLPALAQWQALPERFAEYYEGILAATSAGELKSLAHLLIASSRQFIARYQPQPEESVQTPDFRWLAEWYQELRTCWNRTYHYCAVCNADAAFVDACNLQNELSIIAEEFRLGEIDLLGCFDAQNLAPLSQRAAEVEQFIVDAIEKQGVKIKRYDTLEDFLAANP